MKPTYAEIIVALPEMLMIELDSIRDVIDKVHPRPQPLPHPRRQRTAKQIAARMSRERRQLFVEALRKLRDEK